MNIVVKPGNADDDQKTLFAKLMFGTAAGFIATAVVEGIVGKFLGRKNNKSNATQS